MPYDEHRRGITDALLTRLVPWGLVFDPDRKLDVFTFSNGASNVEQVGLVSATNYQGYVPSMIVGKVKGWNGGTDYSYLIERTLRVLKASEERGDQAYFLFLGVSNQGSRFPFLERLGDRFNNTGFVPIANLRQLVQMSNEDLNAKLISDELLAGFAGK